MHLRTTPIVVLVVLISVAGHVPFLTPAPLAAPGSAGEGQPPAKSAVDTASFLPRPAATKLMLWVKAEDIQGLAVGAPVGLWPDASGGHNDLRSEGEARPLYQKAASTGRPAVRFEGLVKAKPRVAHAFEVPLKGEWAAITVFAVGQGLTGPGWLDTAPGSDGCLRVTPGIQVTGDALAVNPPFPALARAAGIHVVCATIGKDASKSTELVTYADGKRQKVSRDKNPLFGVRFRNARVGNTNSGETAFRGELCELLIYRGRLSDVQRDATHRYLLVKYGLAKGRPGETAAAALAPGAGGPKADGPKPLPRVDLAPVRRGLQLWLRADDVKGAKDGQPVDAVPDASGLNHAIGSAGPRRPRFAPDALAGRPGLRFEGRAGKGAAFQALDLALQGAWDEITVLAAGQSLTGAGLFDTAPGQEGCLRQMGFLQLTGAPLSVATPYPFPPKDAGPHIVAVTVRKRPKGGQALSTYIDGHLQAEAHADTLSKIRLISPRVGTNNNGEANLSGLLGELLIYDRGLDEDELAQNTRYLGQRYGLAIKSALQARQEREARSPWSLKLPQLPRTFSYFGNSFGGKDAWVQSGIADLCAAPDGSVAAISIWDEPHKEIGFYKDGKCVGPVIHGGGGALASDGKYLYAGVSGMGKKTAGLRRLTLDGKAAPWPTMKDAKDWPVWDTPAEWQEVRGLALGGGHLYLTTDGRDEVRVHDVPTGRLKYTFAVKAPKRLAVDRNGNLWVGGADGVAQYTPQGKATGKAIRGVAAGGLAVDSQGRLLVADAGERRQVIYFDLAGAMPREVKALGKPGGVFSGPVKGEAGDDRLPPLNALAVNAAGEVFVSGMGALRAYGPAGQSLWQLECTVFCQCGDFDPARDGNDVFNAATLHQHRPDRPAGQDWAWTAITADEERFGELAAPGGQLAVRRLGGRLYAFTLDNPVRIHRQEERSLVWVPCGLIRTNETRSASKLPPGAPKGRFLWCDVNGNGRIDPGEYQAPPAGTAASQIAYSVYVDDAGGIWEPQDRRGVRYLPLRGFTAGGAPRYDFAHEKLFDRPPEFIQIERAVYFPKTDTMYLSGNTWDHSVLGTEHWGVCGREVICYDRWTKPSRKVRCRMPFPEGAANVKALAVAHEANLLFAAEMETSVVFVYDTRNGRLLGIVEPDARLVGPVGWVDIDAGIRAFTRRDGEVLLIVEDSWSQKEMIYRIPPGVGAKD